MLSWIVFHGQSGLWRVDCLLSLLLQLSDILSKEPMASRCINTLNDLDKISDRIFYKHSKVKIPYELNGEVR